MVPASVTVDMAEFLAMNARTCYELGVTAAAVAGAAGLYFAPSEPLVVPAAGIAGCAGGYLYSAGLEAAAQ